MCDLNDKVTTNGTIKRRLGNSLVNLSKTREVSICIMVSSSIRLIQPPKTSAIPRFRPPYVSNSNFVPINGPVPKGKTTAARIPDERFSFVASVKIVRLYITGGWNYRFQGGSLSENRWSYRRRKMNRPLLSPEL